MYRKAVQDLCAAPVFFDGGLAFMFETCLPLRVAPQCRNWLDEGYSECWMALRADFSGWELVDEAHHEAGQDGQEE